MAETLNMDLYPTVAIMELINTQNAILQNLGNVFECHSKILLNIVETWHRHIIMISNCVTITVFFIIVIQPKNRKIL